MIPYILIFLMTFIIFWLKDQDNKIAFFSLLVACIIMVGSRDMIGGYDIYIYGEVFERPIEFILALNIMEWGYRMYNVVLKYLIEDRYYFFFFTTAIIYLMHFFTIKKLSPILLFSIFLYFCKFFLFSFVYIRQFMAMGLLWMAIPFIFKRKYFIASLFILVASQFHITSILFVLILLINQFQFTKTQLFFLFATFLFVFLTPLGNVLLGTLAEASENDKLQFHAKGTIDAANYFYIIEAGLMFLICLKFKDSFYKKRDTTIIFNGIVLYIILSIAAVTNGTYARFGWFFFIFVILGLPYIYLFMKHQNERIIFKFCIFVYFAAMLIRMLIIWDGGDFIPYKAFYLNTERHGRFEFMEYRENIGIENKK